MLYVFVLTVTLLSASTANGQLVRALKSLQPVDEPVLSACQVGCANCKLQRDCVNDQAQFSNCVSSQVCYSDVCADKQFSSYCTCSQLADGSYPDPYNPRFYYTCVNGEENYQACASNEIFSLNKGGCLVVPDCTELGCFSFVEDCQAYYCCQKDMTTFSQDVFMCPKNNVYEKAASGCVSLKPACISTGPSVDPYKCDLYHICSSVGDKNPSSLCCPFGKMYSMITYSCVDDDGTCTDAGICYDSYYEINVCNRCTTEGERFPSGKCSQYYYSCVYSGGNLMEEINECPEGQIYNPTQGWCDNPALVIGC